MNAELLLNERHVITENSFVEMVVWLVPSPVKGSCHDLKYRLVLVVDGQCVLRYDNEAGKGDHKHVGKDEIPYAFTSAQALLDDFWQDADTRRP